MTTFVQSDVLYAGDDAELQLTVYDRDGVLQSLTGHTIIFRLGHWPAGPTILEKTSEDPDEIDDTDFATGVALVFLTEDDTEDLAGPYAVQFIDRDEANVEAVVASGRITFLAKLAMMPELP